ncbi:AraC family transcriptional regulator [Streptomyces aurantiacus]|uniref:AraC family transcriptional regulator n=1 Tax=Streptomyces aurantiacus TaxID=47760 RepID=A0A7G1NYK5_9ACTN|nr:AraC family transcriptional regulator [Streptomyces aurantiacus]BCL28258.1 AraC family transcriptional regulator [Streptomyces aurantiacus]
MVSDPLSEVFDLIEIKGLMSSGFTTPRGRAWVARGSVTRRLKFIAVVRGHARLTASGTDQPLDLEPGDVAILNNQAWLEVRGGPEDQVPYEVDVSSASHLLGDEEGEEGQEGADALLGGHIALNPIGEALLTQALPPVGHVRAATATAPLRARLDQLLDEVTGERVGSAFAIRQHGQLLVLDMLRVYLGQAALPPGWLRLLVDERLHAAVTLMHAEPGRVWRLETLAQAAAMSRTAFATRFREVAGMPPLTYLSHWRMLLAQRALRDGDDHVGALASTLGYASESAFSTAFKRETGEPPLRYRKRVRAEDTRPVPSDDDRDWVTGGSG